MDMDDGYGYGYGYGYGDEEAHLLHHGDGKASEAGDTSDEAPVAQGS